jgi:hypothetical protein
VARGLGLLRRLRNELPPRILKSLYHSLINPYLSYGCLLWTSSFVSSFKRVQILQNKVVHALGEYERLENSTLSCFTKMKILNVYKLRDCQVTVFVYQCLNRYSPECWEIFKSNSFYHCYETRYSSGIVSEARSTQRGSLFLLFVGTQLWNSLPEGIKGADNFN